MYRQVLLAYDGSQEGRMALREGALLAQACRARVFLLCVAPATASVQVAEATYPGPIAHLEAKGRGHFEEAMGRLRQLGVDAEGRCVTGDPSQEIARYARETRVDLVVVGHRRQTLLERWWSGQSGGYLIDNTPCSLLVARAEIGDAEFEAAFKS